MIKTYSLIYEALDYNYLKECYTLEKYVGKKGQCDNYNQFFCNANLDLFIKLLLL